MVRASGNQKAEKVFRGLLRTILLLAVASCMCGKQDEANVQRAAVDGDKNKHKGMTADDHRSMESAQPAPQRQIPDSSVVWRESEESIRMITDLSEPGTSVVGFEEPRIKLLSTPSSTLDTFAVEVTVKGTKERGRAFTQRVRTIMEYNPKNYIKWNAIDHKILEQNADTPQVKHPPPRQLRTKRTTTQFPNGKTKEEFFVDTAGGKQGKYIRYYLDGKKAEELFYQDNIPDYSRDECLWYTNGQVNRIVRRQDTKNYEQETFDKNGNLTSQVLVKDGHIVKEWYRPD